MARANAVSQLVSQCQKLETFGVRFTNPYFFPKIALDNRKKYFLTVLMSLAPLRLTNYVIINEKRKVFCGEIFVYFSYLGFENS